ncbi:hypothetical protein [Halococcoides cellulosivorans]|uniref:Uncharacterized protein n=1 Tax=Halococcoides cellulosivorans TaxID=1679096 RepID=A0A2R4WY84_9EURY|nr:hypothetical protein [Halococcoides cellulosivorans]AWB26509.1 hypothetical protein HARCEL1_01660 [Halococcoides cellulosivorans]
MAREPTDRVSVRRRRLLSIGAGVLTAGIGGFVGTATAWDRFDVHFESPTEVWLLVADDLEYDPPAVAHVVVDTGDGVACRLLEVTPAAATTTTGRIGDTAGRYTVVPYSDDQETVLGVLPYNRPNGGGRFHRPRCVIRNDRLDWNGTTAAIEEAACVRAAMAGHWGGDLRDCWFDPVDRRDDGVTIAFVSTYSAGDRASARALVETEDGGFAIAGWTDPGHAGTDALLVKTDASGTEQFRQTYGGSGIDQALDLVQTPDGGYALAGLTNSAGAGGYDAWLISTDDRGIVDSEWTYGGTSRDRAKSIAQTDTGFVIAGDTTSAGAGVADFWLLDVDRSGTVRREWTYGGPLSETCNAVALTDDGGYALAGTMLAAGSLDNDCWLVKTDAAGTQEFDAQFGGDGLEVATDLVATGDGGLALAGVTTSAGQSGDCWLVRTDETGRQLFATTYGGTAGDAADALVRAADGGFALAGYSSSFGDDSRDALLVKTRADGTEEYLQPIDLGVGTDDRARAIVRTSDGGYALAGETAGRDSSAAGSGGPGADGHRGDLLLVKTGPEN